MIAELIAGVYVEIPITENGELENRNTSISIGLIGALDKPAGGTAPSATFEKNFPVKLVAGQKLYGTVFGGADGKKYPIEFSNFRSAGGGGEGETDPALINQVTKNTEQLQNCTKALDDSIVAVISKQGISSNVVGGNVINAGENVLEGEGFSCVVTEDGFGIGEGYENLAGTKNIDLLYATLVERKGYKLKARKDAGDYSTVYISTANLLPSTKYTLSWKFLNGFVESEAIRENNVCGFISKNAISSEFVGIEKEGSTTVTTLPTFGGGFGFGIQFGNNLPIGYEIEVELSLTPTGNKVPFVPYSFKGGEMKFSEPWTTETHSFIFEHHFDGSPELKHLFTTSKSGSGSGSCRAFVTDIPEGNGYSLISKNFAKLIHENGSEYTVELRDQSVNIDGMFNLLYSDYSSSVSTVRNMFSYFSNFTEKKLRDELPKIRSKNYQLPPHMQGTLFPIEGMLRRGNEYGIVNDIIEVTDLSRDLWYIEPGLYEIIDNNLVIHYVRVNADGSITGTALEDVSGRLRVAAAIALPAQVRKVK